MPTRTIADPTIGLQTFAEGLFGDANEVDYVIDGEQSDLTTPRRSQVGWGLFSQRVFSRSYEYSARVISDVSKEVAVVSFGTFSGGLFGELRTDIRYPIVKSLKFTLDRQGCGDFELVLNAVPPFPIVSGAVVSIRIGASPTPNYTGYVEYSPDQGTRQSEYRVRGFGYRKQLKEWVRMPDDTTSIYPFGLKAGEIFDDIMNNIVRFNTNVGYNSAKIDLTAGVATANELDFGTFDVARVFDSLALLAGCEWGVDEAGEAYFQEKSVQPVRVHFVGFDMGKFEVVENSEQIANLITVERQQGRGSGANGYTVGGVYQDLTSIAKYGLREYTQKVPGFFADAEVDLIGNAVLEDRKDPKLTGKVERFYLRKPEDIIQRGLHRFIMPVEDYPSLIVEDESFTAWTKSGAGDTVLSNSSTLVVQGNDSLKIEFTNGQNDVITTPVVVNGDIQAVEFWIRGNITGDILEFGFGLTNYNENVQTVSIGTANVWSRFRWDTSSLDQRKIRVIGFKVLTTDAGEIYIDSVTSVIRGQRHYDLDMRRTVCTIGGGSYQTAEFGQLPISLSDYTSALLQQVQENSIAMRSR